MSQLWKLNFDRLPKEVNNKKIQLKNLLSRNSLFQLYFPGKTQRKNSKGRKSFRDCIQKPSTAQLTRTS